MLGVCSVQTSGQGSVRHRHREGQFLGRRGSVGAHLAGGDTEFLLAEDIACEDVDDAEQNREDARGDDDAPVGGAEGFLAGGFFVEVAEYGDTGDDHQEAEGDEAVDWREEGPVAGNVGSEEREFGHYQEH